MTVGVEGGVHEEAVFAEVLMEVVEASGVLVDDGVPVSVEGGDGAVVDVDQKGGVGLGDDWCGEEEGGEEEASGGLKHEVSGQTGLVRGFIENVVGDIILRSLNNCLREIFGNYG
jgi:hypothetical protein